MKPAHVTLCLLALTVSSAATLEAAEPQSPPALVEIGESLYEPEALKAFSRLIGRLQLLVDPQVDPYEPGFATEAATQRERLHERFVNPVDPNLFTPLEPEQPLAPIRLLGACELLDQTWNDLAARECACEWFQAMIAAGQPALRAYARATLAGNRVASGGSCPAP